MWKVSVIFIAALSLVACSKSGDAGGGGGGGAAKSLTLAKFNNLKVDAPEGSKAGDAPIGKGVMIRGPNLVVTIEEASDTRPKDLKAAKEDADMYSPKNMKEEKLADGWAMTFENKGGMGTNYFVQVRREIGGKSYWCETTCSKPEQMANALAACKSLKP
ncbi:MAG: hypothetical protein JRJ87_15660 [Deltaproteobacteria bacterium]|nr:hypothetical protein [Deltaproteobacteria bacterium]